jgi:hypothetical protein
MLPPEGAGGDVRLRSPGCVPPNESASNTVCEAKSMATHVKWRP